MITSAELAGVVGDLVELGVNAGSTFEKLARVAAESGRHAWGFDSFDGMGEPGPRDGTNYPRGRLRVPLASVEARLAHIDRKHWSLVKGWLPASWTLSVPIAFAYLDLDHYGPTKAMLPVVWRAMSPGGVMACDDYLPETQQELLATCAIMEWDRAAGVSGRVAGQQVFFTKP